MNGTESVIGLAFLCSRASLTTLLRWLVMFLTLHFMCWKRLSFSKGRIVSVDLSSLVTVQCQLAVESQCLLRVLFAHIQCHT